MENARQLINAQNELDGIEERRRGVNHPLTVALIVQVTSTGEEEQEVVASEK